MIQEAKADGSCLIDVIQLRELLLSCILFRVQCVRNGIVKLPVVGDN